MQDQYPNDKVLFLVNPKGQLRKLYTPIRVQCIDPIANIQFGAWVYIDAIKGELNGDLVYLILGREYPHRNFHIVIGF